MAESIVSQFVYLIFSANWIPNQKEISQQKIHFNWGIGFFFSKNILLIKKISQIDPAVLDNIEDKQKADGHLFTL